MAEKTSLRRSLRTRSLDGRPSPYVNPDEVHESNDGEDDDDDDDNNNASKILNQKQIDNSIQPDRALRKRKISFKECVIDLKGGSSQEESKCNSTEHLQTILSNKWFVDYYENEEERVFEVKECCLCPKKFFTNFALKKHFDIEHKKNKFNCLRCSQTFSHEEHLKFHERQTHCERLMPSAMFRTPEVQQILHKCLKQEETSQMTYPQPQRQLLQSQGVDIAIQVELQTQSLHSVPTHNEHLKTETLSHKSKILSQTQHIFKIPSQIHHLKIKTPLKTQQKNFQTQCLTKQKIFETDSKQQVLRSSLKRHHSCLNSPLKSEIQPIEAPLRSGQLNSLLQMKTQQQTFQPPPLPLKSQSLDRRQSFTHPHSCDICKKQFSQNGYLKIHMESVHAPVIRIVRDNFQRKKSVEKPYEICSRGKEV